MLEMRKYSIAKKSGDQTWDWMLNSAMISLSDKPSYTTSKAKRICRINTSRYYLKTIFDVTMHTHIFMHNAKFIF